MLSISFLLHGFHSEYRAWQKTFSRLTKNHEHYYYTLYYITWKNTECSIFHLILKMILSKWWLPSITHVIVNFKFCITCWVSCGIIAAILGIEPVIKSSMINGQWPQRKKIIRHKITYRVGHWMSPCNEIKCPGKSALKISIEFLYVWAVASSCWNNMFQFLSVVSVGCKKYCNNCTSHFLT